MLTTPMTPDGTQERPAGSFNVWLWGLVLSLLFSGALTLLEGDTVTHYYDTALSAKCDNCFFAWADLAQPDSHPVVAAYRDANFTLGARLLRALAGLGLPFALAASVYMVLLRTLFGAGLCWFVFAALHHRWLALAMVPLSYALEPAAVAYGIYGTLPIAGQATQSLFWITGALLLAAPLWLAVPVTLFHAVFHPVGWAFSLPFFAVLLCKRLGRDVPPWGWGAAAAFPLVTAALAHVMLGRLQQLTPETVMTYWHLAHTRNVHLMLLHPHHYLPLVNHICWLLGFWWLVRRGIFSATPVLAALVKVGLCTGAGALLTHLLLVETHGSVAAGMLLPLRLQNLLFVTGLLTLAAALGQPRLPPRQHLLTAVMVLGLLLTAVPVGELWPVALPLFALLLPMAGVPAVRPTAPALGLAVGLPLALTFPVLPFNGGSLFPFVKVVAVLGLMTGGWWVIRRHGEGAQRLSLGALAVLLGFHGTALFAYRHVTPNFETSLLELKALVKRQPPGPEPVAGALAWITEHTGSGDTVLTHPGTYLSRVTPRRTTLNYWEMNMGVYIPAQAPAISEEIAIVHGLDVAELARRRETLWPHLEAAWADTRRRALHGELPEDHSVQWVAEPAETPPAEDAEPAFENTWLRIYAVPGRTAPADM